MTGRYAGSLEKGRAGRVFVLVVGLHAALLYGVFRHRHDHIHSVTETRIDLVWVELPPAEPVKPMPARPSQPALFAPKRPTLATVPPQEARRVERPLKAEEQAEPAPTDRKALDLQKILSDVGPAIRKLDSEQPAGQAMRAEPQQSTFEAKLDKVLANAKSAPKFYEGARIEAISSGTELDAGVIKYKITTFLGSYCVTYKDGAQVYVGTCPIKF